MGTVSTELQSCVNIPVANITRCDSLYALISSSVTERNGSGLFHNSSNVIASPLFSLAILYCSRIRAACRYGGIGFPRGAWISAGSSNLSNCSFLKSVGGIGFPCGAWTLNSIGSSTCMSGCSVLKSVAIVEVSSSL